jgi:hypothetical protein
VDKAYNSINDVIGHRIYLQSERPLDQKYKNLLNDVLVGYEETKYERTPQKSINLVLRDYEELRKPIQDLVPFEIGPIDYYSPVPEIGRA